MASYKLFCSIFISFMKQVIVSKEKKFQLFFFGSFQPGTIDVCIPFRTGRAHRICIYIAFI